MSNQNIFTAIKDRINAKNLGATVMFLIAATIMMYSQVSLLKSYI